MRHFSKEEKTWLAFLVILFFTVLFVVVFAKPAQATPDCDLYPDESWCTGPSMKECPQGIEIPEDWDCNSMNTNDTDALGDPYEHEQTTRENSCELDGTCDDSCPHRADCLEGEFDWLECQDGSEPDEHNMCPVPDFDRALPLDESIDQLPHTGWPATLLITAILAICIGTMLVVKPTK